MSILIPQEKSSRNLQSWDACKIGKASQIFRQIVKETIGVVVNEKAVLRFYQTALSFTSISIFPW
jgi:hypothetical protein